MSLEWRYDGAVHQLHHNEQRLPVAMVNANTGWYMAASTYGASGWYKTKEEATEAITAALVAARLEQS